MLKDISRREAMKAALRAGAYATPVVLSATVPVAATAATPAVAVQPTTTAAPAIIATTAAPAAAVQRTTTAAPAIIATTAAPAAAVQRTTTVAPVIITTTAAPAAAVQRTTTVAPVIITTTAAPAPAASPTTTIVSAPIGDQLDAEGADFLARINAYRLQNNVPPLVISLGLMRTATWLSADMAATGSFSHTDSRGRDLTGRLAAFGVTGNTIWGEIIAAGDAGAAGTFTQFKNSPVHNENMLRAEYRTIGIGRAQGSPPYGWYWTIDFGNANG